jgi:uncharacterized cupredoxin-like copper-binding protein
LLTTASGIALTGLSAGCLSGSQGSGTETPNADATAETTTGANETTTDADETTTGDSDSVDIEGELADAPTALKVTNRELYETDGEVGLRGTIENTGDEIYKWVEAEVTLQDDQGEILYEFIDESEEELTEGLKPGKTWEFDVVFEEAKMSEVRTYTLDLEGRTGGPDEFGYIDQEVDQQDPNLEITAHQLEGTGTKVSVTGTVENVGNEDIESVEVSVVLYDDQNNELFDFNDTVEEENDVERLAPGESWSFKVEFDDVDMNEVDRYVISADSDLV